jgi:hypothetical protein
VEIIATPEGNASEATRNDWWNALYDERHGDTASSAAYEEFDDDELCEDDESDDTESRERAPRQSLREYVADHGDQQRRFWRLVYNGSAAGAGWGLGWVGDMERMLHNCAAETGDAGAALILGVAVMGVVIAVIDRRTRHWYSALAWACRIPLASAVVALALFTPAITL